MTLRAIVGGTVVDGTGRPPIPNATVVVEGGRVRSVMPATDVAPPIAAEVIDATGRYVIPGLMNANAGLCFLPPDMLLEYEGRYSALIEEAAQITLKAGVTTEYSTLGPLEPLVTARDRIDRGEVTASRIFIGGNIIGFGGPLSSDFMGPVRGFGADTVERINSIWEQGVGPDLLWLTPKDVRIRVRQYIERSAIDLLKYAACSHNDALITFSEAAQRAIVEEGHRAGLTVQAHTYSVESLRMEIEAGADLLTHGNITGKIPIPDETLKIIVDQQLPVSAIVPTSRFLAWVQDHGPEWHRTIGFTETTDQNNRRLIEAGARLLLNVDGIILGPRLRKHPLFAGTASAVDYPQQLHDGHFLWLEAVIERGMAPMDALQCATRNIAEAYGHANELGTLEPGKHADLLILDGDPLADVRNYRRIVEIVKGGAVVDRHSLPTNRLLTT